MQRRLGLRITTMQSCVGIAVSGYCRAAWVQSGVRRWMSLTPVRARQCSTRWARAYGWYIDYSPCSLYLLRNSSKKPFYFDVLKVSFRYLQVEDKQGSSVVEWLSAFLSPRRNEETLRMH